MAIHNDFNNESLVIVPMAWAKSYGAVAADGTLMGYKAVELDAAPRIQTSPRGGRPVTKNRTSAFLFRIEGQEMVETDLFPHGIVVALPLSHSLWVDEGSHNIRNLAKPSSRPLLQAIFRSPVLATPAFVTALTGKTLPNERSARLQRVIRNWLMSSPSWGSFYSAQGFTPSTQGNGQVRDIPPGLFIFEYLSFVLALLALLYPAFEEHRDYLANEFTFTHYFFSDDALTRFEETGYPAMFEGFDQDGFTYRDVGYFYSIALAGNKVKRSRTFRDGCHRAMSILGKPHNGSRGLSFTNRSLLKHINRGHAPLVALPELRSQFDLSNNTERSGRYRSAINRWPVGPGV
jgi:hypothetical protein